MRVDVVRSGGFGPLPTGAALTLAPGLTVVWGPNEAGKSSWHAALFAGLCGQRRGPGRTAAQRDLEEAHRPWDGGAWRVSTTVTLADGRVLELRHDLDAPDRSQVLDRDTGTDLTGELIFDGGPDGALLLGLNRRTLPHTVMVRQADVLACTDGSTELQQMLQRAAATAGDAATAEEAIRRVEEVRAEAVGTERARTKPLAQAERALAAAEEELDAARADHVAYVRLRADHDDAAASSEREGTRLARLDAERARRDAAVLTGRLDAAERVARRLPAEVVTEVETTRHAETHRDRPGADAVGAEGTAGSAPAARGPGAVGGDTEPHPDVEAAAERWQEAATALRWHDRREPAQAAAPVHAEPAELRAAAEALSAPPGGVDEDLAARVRVLQSEQSRRRTLRLSSAGAGAITAALAVLALAGGETTSAVLAGVVTALLAVAGVVAGRFDREGELAEARAELAAQRRDVAKDAERHHHAEQRARELGVPAKPDHLHQLAREVAHAHELQAARRTWADEHAGLVGDLADADAVLRDVLADRGVDLTGHDDVSAALSAYRRGCRERADQAQQTARRDAAQLASLLGGHTLDGLRGATEQRREAADALEATLDRDDADLSALAELSDDELATQRREVADAAERARQRQAEVAGGLRRHEETMRSVVEAEEAHARWVAEVERLRSLGEVLDVARAHLRAASDRVGREVAPALRRTVERWLPALTDGRYERVAVDPTSLEVTVETPEGGWRPAGRLSHGTSEQVYLLLRVALAEHLVTTDEPAPLLLDEVTAQSDDERTEAMLRLLVELADERQVVLFTQESLVREWARTNVDGERDGLVVLDPARPQPASPPGSAPDRSDTGFGREGPVSEQPAR